MYLPADPSKLQFGAYHASSFDQEQQLRKDLVASRSWQLKDNEDTFNSEAEPIVFNF